MPNWIRNIVTFDDTEENVAKILEFVKSEDSEFDFNNICQIPKELENTSAPTRIVSQEEYDKIQADPSSSEWQRGCMTEEVAKELRDKYKADNWYDWNIHNWGTKWNATDVYIIEDYVEFNTAWSNPFEVLKKLSEKFPTTRIIVRYADEDFGHNVGEYELLDGEEVECYIPDGGSRDAYELAYEIQNDPEYYAWEVLFNVEDEEEVKDNSFYEVMIEKSYREFGKVDESFSKNVLEKFLSLALEDENYELAGEIKVYLKSK